MGADAPGGSEVVKKPSLAQRRALRVFAEGDGPGESWSQVSASENDSLAWFRHERTIRSLERHGWVDAYGITQLGLEALKSGEGDK